MRSKISIVFLVSILMVTFNVYTSFARDTATPKCEIHKVAKPMLNDNKVVLPPGAGGIVPVVPPGGTDQVIPGDTVKPIPIVVRDRIVNNNNINNKNYNTNVNTNLNNNVNNNMNNNVNTNLNNNTNKNTATSTSKSDAVANSDSVSNAESNSNSSAYNVFYGGESYINSVGLVETEVPLLQSGKIGDYTKSLPRISGLKPLGENDVVVSVLGTHSGVFFWRIRLEDVVGELIDLKEDYQGEKVRFNVMFKDSVTSGCAGAPLSGTAVSQNGVAGAIGITNGYCQSTANPQFIITFYEIE
jgi:hypothetical protein